MDLLYVDVLDPNSVEALHDAAASVADSIAERRLRSP